jgi:heme oxygenase
MEDAAGREETLRFALREGTRVSHQRTDDAFSELDLTTREGLGTYLLAQDLALSAIEPLLRDAKDLPPLPLRRHLVTKDLGALGIERPDVNLAFSKDAHPLGVAYVIGGSHLGGQILEQRWSQSRDPAVLGAHNFVKSAALRQYWSGLQVFLKAPAPSVATLHHVLQGADLTFDHFRHALRLVQGEMARGRR